MRIYVGRKGCAKTQTILREISTKTEQYVSRQLLIVPELYSHAYERRLAESSGNHGARTAEVIGFSRLASRIFSEVGGLADTVLSPAGRLLTLYQALTKVSAGLRRYGQAIHRTETLMELLRVIDELKCYCVSPADLLEMREQLEEESHLSDKLYDLGQIATMYDALCENNLPDPRDALTLLAQRLPQSNWVRDAEIYLDGFTGLTPQEMDVLAVLLRLHLPITVVLTYDPAQPDLFAESHHFYTALQRLCKKTGEPFEVLDCPSRSQVRPHDLSVLEQSVLLPLTQTSPSDQSSVKLYAGQDPLDECIHVAAEIRRRVREEGLAYRDFTIMAQDFDTYRAPLQIVMEQYDIPLFLSEKNDILQKPAIKLATLALDTIVYGFRYEDVFACLKSGFFPVSASEVDILENYALLWNLRGNLWKVPLQKHPDGYGKSLDANARQKLETLEQIRLKALTPLLDLEACLRTTRTVAEHVRALYAFFDTIHLAEQMQARAQTHTDAGRVQLAQEYAQLWEILVSAMEQFVWSAGETETDTEQFAKLFALVLSQYDVGTIPTSLDRVACGEMTRMLGSEIKHLILLGVNDGVFPKPPSEGGILNIQDRTTLEAYGMHLSAFGAEEMLAQQEHIYQVLASPKCSLLLSYSLQNSAGEAIYPSYLIAKIQQLLPGVPLFDSPTCTEADALEAEHPRITFASAFLGGETSPLHQSAYALYQNDARLLQAKQAKQTVEMLSAEASHALYGKRFHLTASRLDQFYACRFAYFMRYGLKAKPRQKATFSALEAGSFIHEVLEKTLSDLLPKHAPLRQIDRPEALRKLKQCAQTYLEEKLGGVLTQTARFRYLFRRLVGQMEGLLTQVLEELTQSDFYPIDYELDFSKHGDLPPIDFSKEGIPVDLSGKVDRVDGYIKNGRLYIRVMDYKTGKKSFSLSDIWYGLNMQLVLYLSALKETGLERYRTKISQSLCDIVPAGILYVPLRDTWIDIARHATMGEIQKEQEKLLKRSGLLTEDIDVLTAMEHALDEKQTYLPVKIDKTQTVTAGVASLAQFGKLARLVQKRLLEMAQALQDGDVQKNPIERKKNDPVCHYCDFMPACAFDPAQGDCVFSLTQLKDEDFWKLVNKEDCPDAMDA